MKKTLLLILTFLCYLSSSAEKVGDTFSYKHQDKSINYYIIRSKEVCTKLGTVSGSAGNPYVSGDVIIPDKVSDNAGEKYKVTTIGKASFYKNSNITSIVFPETLNFIHDYSFYLCQGLSGSLILPNSVTSIGENAFYGCSKLTSLKLSETLATIDDNAFVYCKGLNMIEYPSYEPCTANSNIFSSEIYNNATLIIPVGSLEIFKQVSPWSKFLNIVEEYPLSGIEDVVADDVQNAIDYALPYEVYNLQGLLMGHSTDGLASGIYIIRQANKTAKIAL